MDPITIIVTAVTAGAVAASKDVAAQAVKDSYAALKALIVRKFGQEADVADAIEGLEKKPESEARQSVLKEELETARAARDVDLVQQAQALLDLLKQHGLEPAISYHAELRGSGAIAQGPGAIAAGKGGVAVGGDVHGGIHTGGKGKGK
jgi:hypothetical protein